MALGITLAGAACEHPAPPDYQAPEVPPPPTDVLPARLTFSLGDDRNPSVANGVISYSRFPAETAERDRCIALLPWAGGTIMATSCPPPSGGTADSVATWVEPVRSPDGQRIAYVHQKSPELNVRTSLRELRVAPADDPEAVEFRWNAFMTLPDGRLVDAVMKPSWRDANTIRLLVGVDHIPKVKGGGAARFTDTTVIAQALVDVDLATGAAVVVPGADSAVAYARAPDGGTWIVTMSHPAVLLHRAPGASLWDSVGSFSAGVLDLAVLDGLAVAVHLDSGTVETLDPATGALRRERPFGLEPWILRLAPVPGTGRLVAEVEMPLDQFGGRANLWLLDLP